MRSVHSKDEAGDEETPSPQLNQLPCTILQKRGHDSAVLVPLFRQSWQAIYQLLYFFSTYRIVNRSPALPSLVPVRGAFSCSCI